jgi:hypothetical protein
MAVPSRDDCHPMTIYHCPVFGTIRNTIEDLIVMNPLQGFGEMLVYIGYIVYTIVPYLVLYVCTIEG